MQPDAMQSDAMQPDAMNSEVMSPDAMPPEPMPPEPMPPDPVNASIQQPSQREQGQREQGQRVVLKLKGNLSKGVHVELEIGPEGQPAISSKQGSLPADSLLHSALQNWQQQYYGLGDSSTRITTVGIKYDGSINQRSNCLQAASELRQSFLQWLTAQTFQAIEYSLREKLNRADSIRLVICTSDPQLPHLPWHLWSFIDHYPHAEVVFSVEEFEQSLPPRSSRLRILAILGDSQGIDAENDRQQLNQLRGADVTFLVEPQRQDINDALWEQGWDILFFAGHSQSHAQVRDALPPGSAHPESSETSDSKNSAPLFPNPRGRIFLNREESLTMPDLRYGLKCAIANHLQLAIFNSCDGLGLAQDLAELQLPNLIVMREPIPDAVAQAFLKYFLRHFSSGIPLHRAVRQAREQLQGIEAQYPCATWLPVVYQNPVALPFIWPQQQPEPVEDNPAPVKDNPEPSDEPEQSLEPVVLPQTRLQRLQQSSWLLMLACSLGVTAAVMLARGLEPVRSLEHQSFDVLTRSRPNPQGVDPRIIVITVTEEDVQAQHAEKQQGSLSDSALEQMILQLKAADSRVIGLDLYRSFPVFHEHQELKQFMETSDNFVAICRHADETSQIPETPPPPEVAASAQGFSDVVLDPDGVVRRHLIAMAPAAGRCLTPYALSLQLAQKYLAPEGIELTFEAEEHWQLGKAKLLPLKSVDTPYSYGDTLGFQIPLNYRTVASNDPTAAFERVSLGQVLSGQVNPSFFQDRVVLIGSTAETYNDYLPTPFSQGPQHMPGVMLQAQMTSQLIDAALGERSLLWLLPRWGIVLWLGGIALLGSWLGQSQRPLLWIGMTLGTSLGLCLMTWLIFSYASGWMPLTASLLALWGGAGVSHLSKTQLSHLRTRKSPVLKGSSEFSESA